MKIWSGKLLSTNHPAGSEILTKTRSCVRVACPAVKRAAESECHAFKPGMTWIPICSLREETFKERRRWHLFAPNVLLPDHLGPSASLATGSTSSFSEHTSAGLNAVNIPTLSSTHQTFIWTQVMTANPCVWEVYFWWLGTRPFIITTLVPSFSQISYTTFIWPRFSHILSCFSLTCPSDPSGMTKISLLTLSSRSPTSCFDSGRGFQ